MNQSQEYDWLEQLRAPGHAVPTEQQAGNQTDARQHAVAAGQSTAMPAAMPIAGPRGNGELWVLRSLTGGVGRSSLAINLAFEAAKQGNRVCLVDLDMQNPALHIWLAIPDAKTAVAAAVRLVAQQRLDAASLDSLLVEVTARHSQVHLLSSARPAAAELDLEALEVLLLALQGKYDLVIADSSPGVNSQLHRLLARLAQRQYLVVPAEPVGLAGLLSSSAAHPSLQTATVLFNRMRSAVIGGNPQGQLNQLLTRHSSLPVAAFLPLETEIFDLAQHRGVPLRSINGRSKVLAAIATLLGGRDRAAARRRARG